MTEPITLADLATRIILTTGQELDVRPLIADRIGADALRRRYGLPEDNEIKAYLVAYAAAHRTQAFPGSWEDFVELAVATVPISLDGRPVRIVNGDMFVDSALVEEDPTQPGH